MPTTRPRPNETREMRLVGKVIELSSLPEIDLPAFIAVRRLPGDSWRTWDEISFELAEVTGEIVTDMTLRHWAKRYDIPEDTKRDDTGATAKRGYVTAMSKLGTSDFRLREHN